MPRGPTPKPTALKLLQGNAGHRPDDGRAEVQMPAGLPEAPAHLSAEARREWFVMMQHLAQVHGLIRRTDHAVVGVYCSYYGQWQAAEQQIPAQQERLAQLDERIGQLDQNISQGLQAVAAAKRKAERELKAALVEEFRQQRSRAESDRGRALNALNVAIGERNKARKEMRGYLTELGLTPAARSRIRLDVGQGQLPLGDTPSNPLDAGRAAFAG